MNKEVLSRNETRKSWQESPKGDTPITRNRIQTTSLLHIFPIYPLPIKSRIPPVSIRRHWFSHTHIIYQALLSCYQQNPCLPLPQNIWKIIYIFYYALVLHKTSQDTAGMQACKKHPMFWIYAHQGIKPSYFILTPRTTNIFCSNENPAFQLRHFCWNSFKKRKEMKLGCVYKIWWSVHERIRLHPNLKTL